MEAKTLFSVGESLRKTFTVTDEYTAAHVGSGTVKVLSTPSMILFMEMTALELLEKKLPEGFSSVGVTVNISHLAATLVGKTVKVSAEIVSIDRKRVSFAVEVNDGRVAGKGTHDRMIIELESFLARLEK